jgi:response regulator RpfG family c-di-GMP phosphodiesterase
VNGTAHYEAADRLARLKRALAESAIGSTGALVSWVGMLYRYTPDTLAHVQRVANTALSISTGLRLSHQQLQQVERAALVHDIGKIIVPDDRDGFNGARPDAQRLAYQVSLAKEVLATSPFLQPTAEIVGALCERVDGSGWPRGSKGAAIPLGARVVGVADALDAMTLLCVEMVLSPEVIAAELVRHAGTRFDSDVVAACLRWMETAPPGGPGASAHLERTV